MMILSSGSQSTDKTWKSASAPPFIMITLSEENGEKGVENFF
jgi:hypothetical protein